MRRLSLVCFFTHPCGSGPSGCSENCSCRPARDNFRLDADAGADLALLLRFVVVVVVVVVVVEEVEEVELAAAAALWGWSGWSPR